MLTVVSGQGSAGVSTVAVALAWSSQGVVVEANPVGGRLWDWLGIPDLGLAGLAAAALRRRGSGVTVADLHECARDTWLGVPVVAAPAAARGAAVTAEAVVKVLPQLAADTDRELVVDAGRWDPGGPVGGLLPWADQVLLLVPPTAAGLAGLAGMLPQARRMCGRRLRAGVSNLLWAGPARYWAGEIVKELAFPVVVLPFDPRTAAAVSGAAGRMPAIQRRPGWWARWRWPLLEAVRRL
jgi:hypothetical protein